MNSEEDIPYTLQTLLSCNLPSNCALKLFRLIHGGGSHVAKGLGSADKSNTAELYDVVNTYDCTPLLTKCTIECYTIYLHSDALFSTHRILSVRNTAVTRLSRQLSLRYISHFDEKCIVIAGKVVGHKDYDYAG